MAAMRTRPQIISLGFSAFVYVKKTINRVSTKYPIMTHSMASRPFLGFFSMEKSCLMNFIIIV